MPFFGTYALLRHHTRVVRREVKRRLVDEMDKGELVSLEFTRGEAEKLRWEHEDEFELNGHMYDVVEKEIAGDSIKFWCWPDHKEARLKKQLNSLVVKELGGDSGPGNIHLQFFKLFSLLYPGSISILNNTHFLEDSVTFHYADHAIIHPVSRPWIPPPQMG